jgi:hypothetical protein
MSPIAAQGPTTLLEALERSRDAAIRHAPGEVPPVALLWTDAEGEWLPLIPLLRERWPGLLTFGAFEPAKRQGPAIWLRCVIERALPVPALPPDTVPVIYIPNVPRTSLRAGDDCPEPLRPLIELQYRGSLWAQRNGRDWTVEAMLVSEDAGLELDVARDERTRRALLGSLTQLALTPVARLRGYRLDAVDFDKLMIEDTPRELLTWMSDPRITRSRWDTEDKAKWLAFCSRCRAEYDFDPEKDGEIVAGEKLGSRTSVWAGVWERFEEAPAVYGGIPSLLRRAKPSALIFDLESWPDENESLEKSLRTDLLSLGQLSAAAARAKIAELEKQHAPRRAWVWARLGQSPLALALQHIAALARHTALSLGGATLDAMASQYAQDGWQSDDAALRALAATKTSEDSHAVEAAVRAVYLSWLDDSATHFQKLAAATPLPTSKQSTPPTAAAGECLLFADGLRFDLGRRLSVLAEQRRLRVIAGRRWAALPSVTATAKPAVTAIAAQISGRKLGDKFEPDVTATGQPATTDRLRKLMEKDGYQVLANGDLGTPSPTARGWGEYGEVDRLGHALQVKLASQVDEQLALLLERIQSLLLAGWQRVQVVTDHGWLLLPGGLPAVQLPHYLVGSRWARCANLRETGQVGVPTAGWFWNAEENFAFGPGISCFGAGNDYAHGGLSLQECLVPELTFSLETTGVPAGVKIAEVVWSGLRCRILVSPPTGGLKVDLRSKANDPATSVSDTKTTANDGRTSLIVSDDSLEGIAVSIVLIGDDGKVLSKQATTVGGDQ